MELNPIDFYPAYEQYYCTRRPRRSSSSWGSTLCIHLLAILTSVCICIACYYYYETNFILNNPALKKDSTSLPLADIAKDLEEIKKEIDRTKQWKKHLDDLFTKIYLKQESRFDDKIEDAFKIYDSDRIGLYDFASIYAFGSIASIPDTEPYPANKTVSFFNLVSMDLMSNPEAIIQPGNLPGNCFAFHGSEGRIRVKLGKKIRIRAVTLEHLKYTDDISSAPKDFEVYGLQDPDDDSGVLLGKFRYDVNGKIYQTFHINKNLTHVAYCYVELAILSNYGKKQYTCVYRFRVHNRSEPRKDLYKKLHHTSSDHV